MKRIRPRITKDEYEIIKQHRGLEAECEKNGIPVEQVNHYWYKGKSYSIHVRNEDAGERNFFLDFKEVIDKELKKSYTYTSKPFRNDAEGCLKWSDLHFGAHIRNLVLTPDYDADILLNGLLESIEDVNNLGFRKTHVHINGDLIESFSGLNHVNSWQSMNKDLIGAKAILLCTELLEKALSKVDNLGSIKIVAGNHDRLSKDNSEDVKGGAAELIAWGLGLKGFDVEFHPYVISHQIEQINHINLHGDKKLSNRPTTDIIWNYGKKGVFNLVCEGHLHKLMESVSVTQRPNIKLEVDAGIDFRRLRLQSFFPGNYYSETLGYATNSGYSIFWDKGNGTLQQLNGTLISILKSA